MNTYSTNNLRNIALVGSTGSGKTTLAEAMLFNGGVINRQGQVENKNTVSDYHEVEHENENSIFPTVLYTEYHDKKINIIDTPGLDDFIGGVISSLNPVESTIMVLNTVYGIEVGTEIISRYLEEAHKPIIFALNQLDQDKANYEQTIESLNQNFGNKITIIQYPVSIGEDFTSIIDVLTMKLYTYPKGGGEPEINEIPDDQKERAESLHNTLVEQAAENDEELMELFFEKETLDEDEMRKGLAKGMLNREIAPVFCISAQKNIGITRLMEFICNIAPAPSESPSPKDIEGNPIEINPQGTPTTFVFKNTYEPHVGEINYFKVISGTITEGMDITNTNTSTKERLAQIFAVAGKNRIKLSKMEAGDIGATVKLKSTKMNHTLSTNKSLQLSPITFPEPKHRVAIKPLNEGEDEKLGEALSRIQEEDPTIIIEHSAELKQIIAHGQGEHHLNILKWQLDNIYKIATEFVAPKIPYRETITKMAQAGHRHKKQSGGAGQFGEVYMVIEPYVEGMEDPKNYKVNGQEIKISVRDRQNIDLPWGGKLIFLNCIVGGAIDTKFHPAIVKGIMEKMEAGPLTGSHARDIRVALYDGQMHPVDSNEVSFKTAGRNAFHKAFLEANPKIMEPIYQVEVLVPSDRMGDVMSDIQGRRGIVQGMNSEKGFEKITAKVPLAELGNYATALSSLTNGRATFSMKFSEYSQVTPEVQEKLLKEHEEEQK